MWKVHGHVQAKEISRSLSLSEGMLSMTINCQCLNNFKINISGHFFQQGCQISNLENAGLCVNTTSLLYSQCVFSSWDTTMASSWAGFASIFQCSKTLVLEDRLAQAVIVVLAFQRVPHKSNRSSIRKDLQPKDMNECMHRIEV